MKRVLSVVGLVTRLFLRRDAGVKFAGGDLFGSCGDVAKLAGREVVFLRTHRWPKRPAEDGAVLVKIAGSGFKIEDRAGFVVGELFEEDGGFVVFAEDSSVQVAGEPGVEASKRVCYPTADAGGFGGVSLGEDFKAFAQAGGVFVGDGEDSDTALGATGFADQMWAATMTGIGKGGVYDLNEGLLHCNLGELCFHAMLSCLSARRMHRAGGGDRVGRKDIVHAAGAVTLGIEGDVEKAEGAKGGGDAVEDFER